MSAQLMMVKYANIEVIAYSNSLHSLEYHGCKRLHFTSAGDDPAIVNSVFFFFSITWYQTVQRVPNGCRSLFVHYAYSSWIYRAIARTHQR